MQILSEPKPVLDFVTAREMLLKAVDNYGDLTYTQRMKVLGWKPDLEDWKDTAGTGTAPTAKCTYVYDANIAGMHVRVPACILGVILAEELHVPTSVLRTHNTTAFGMILPQIETDRFSGITPEAKHLLSEAQYKQDAGLSWGLAVQKAIDDTLQYFNLFPDGTKKPTGVTEDPWEDAGFAESDEPPF